MQRSWGRCWGRRRVDPGGPKNSGKDVSADNIADGDDTSCVLKQAFCELMHSLCDAATFWAGREQQLEEPRQIVQCCHGFRADDCTMQAVDEVIQSLRDPANNWVGKEQKLEELAQVLLAEVLHRFHGGSANDRTMLDLWAAGASSSSEDPFVLQAALSHALEALEGWKSCVPETAKGKFAIVSTSLLLLLKNCSTQQSVTGINLPESMNGSFKWCGGAVAANGKIYGAPYNAGSVLVFDPESSTCTALTLPASLQGVDRKYTGMALGPDGLLYCAPSNVQQVLVIDPCKDELSFVPLPNAVEASQRDRWYGIAAATDSALYCAPFCCDSVLRINPATSTCSLIATGIRGGARWASIAAAPNGLLVCAPYNHDSVLIVNPRFQSCSLIDCGVQGRFKFLDIALGSDGKFYCPPYKADGVLVVDLEAKSCTTVSTRAVDPRNEHQWSSIAQGVDGCLYAAGNGPVLVIDTAFPSELRCLPCPEGAGGHGIWTGMVSVGNATFGIPCDGNTLLKVTSGKSKATNRIKAILEEEAAHETQVVEAACQTESGTATATPEEGEKLADLSYGTSSKGPNRMWSK